MPSVLEYIEVGLKYSKTIATIFLFLVTALGWNVVDNFDKSSTIEQKEKEVAEAMDQITNIAEHFYITTTPKKIKSNAPVVQCTAVCIEIINEKLKEHEKGRLH